MPSTTWARYIARFTRARIETVPSIWYNLGTVISPASRGRGLKQRELHSVIDISIIARFTRARIETRYFDAHGEFGRSSPASRGRGLKLLL